MKRLLAAVLAFALLASLLGGGMVQPAAARSAQAEIVQVEASGFSNIFAVLYDNGTVGVGSSYWEDGKEEAEEMLEHYEPAQDWINVTKIVMTCDWLIALHKNGRVSSIAPAWVEDEDVFDTSHLRNVKDVAVMAPNSCAFFLLNNGTVAYVGDDLSYREICESWKGVKKLVSHLYVDLYAVLRDGTVACMENTILPEDRKDWTDIQNVFPTNGKILGMRKDGSVVISYPYGGDTDIPGEARSLKGAAELYCWDGEVQYGLTENGTLLVSGGENWFRKFVKEEEGITPVSFREFRNVVQLDYSTMLGLCGVVCLREDGTVRSLHPVINKKLSGLKNVEKVVVTPLSEGETILICCLQENGNVAVLEIEDGSTMRLYEEGYIRWDMVSLFKTDNAQIIGLDVDGDLVTSFDCVYMEP